MVPGGAWLQARAIRCAFPRVWLAVLARGSSPRPVQVPPLGTAHRTADVSSAIARALSPRPEQNTGPGNLSRWVHPRESIVPATSNGHIPFPSHGCQFSNRVATLDVFLNGLPKPS